jgi:hypothetical protein
MPSKNPFLDIYHSKGAVVFVLPLLITAPQPHTLPTTAVAELSHLKLLDPVSIGVTP